MIDKHCDFWWPTYVFGGIAVGKISMACTGRAPVALSSCPTPTVVQ